MFDILINDTTGNLHYLSSLSLENIMTMCEGCRKAYPEEFMARAGCKCKKNVAMVVDIHTDTVRFFEDVRMEDPRLEE